VGDEDKDYLVGKQVILNPSSNWGDNEEVQSSNYNVTSCDFLLWFIVLFRFLGFLGMERLLSLF